MKPKTLRILLADDDDDDRNFFREALEQIDDAHQLTTLEDGAELLIHLDQLETQLPDIIFVDINMPKISGLECLKRIKESTKLKNIPVVMYSTSSDPLMVSTSLHRGASFYIQKPSNFDKLVKIIKDVLNVDFGSVFQLNEKSRLIVAV